MNSDLVKSKEEIREAFFNLKTRRDVADLLEVDDKTLIYYLYRQKSNYKTFLIKKKSGGERLIKAPTTNIKILQRKLNLVLLTVHKHKSCAHGFAPDKNIVSNAKNHLNKNYVLNIDIKDFFPS